jgi:hypothetical protein
MSYFDTFKCYNCKNECGKEKHNVLVIDYKGEERYEYVCSEKCFNEIVTSNGFLHHKRYKKIINQEFK